MSKDYIDNIRKNGELIAVGGSNWDYYVFDNAFWSIPKENSVCGASVWCGVKRLRSHLQELMRITGSKSIIPSDWNVINNDFLFSLGIR